MTGQDKAWHYIHEDRNLSLMMFFDSWAIFLSRQIPGTIIRKKLTWTENKYLSRLLLSITGCLIVLSISALTVFLLFQRRNITLVSGSEVLPAVLTQNQESWDVTSLPTEQKAGWAPESTRTLLKKRKILCPYRKSNIISWPFSTQLSHYTGWANPLQEFQTQSYSMYKILVSDPTLRNVGKHRYDNYCPRSQPCDVRGHGSISRRS